MYLTALIFLRVHLCSQHSDVKTAYCVVSSLTHESVEGLSFQVASAVFQFLLSF